MSFTIDKIGDDAHLEWRVDGDAIVHDFIVERSLDNLDFSSIGLVRAGGQMKSHNTYGYVDENIIVHEVPMVYYRLVEINGVGTNMHTASVSLSQFEAKGIIVDHFPHPQKPKTMNIAYKADDNGDLFMQIVNAKGRSMYYADLKTGKGFQMKEVSVGKFPAGAYTIQLFNDEHAVTARMFVE